MVKYLLKFLDFWIPTAVRQDADLHLKGRLMVQSFLLVMPLMIGYSIQYLLLGHYWGGAYCIYGLVTACWALSDFKKRGNFKFSGNFFAFTSFFIVTAFTLTTHGLSTLIAPWIIMVPISGFLLVGIRSGIFWSFASVLLAIALFVIEQLHIQMPDYSKAESIIYVNFTSLIGLIGYIVIILLNNDLGKVRLLNDLRKVKNDVELKNSEITAINQDLEVTVAQRTQGLLDANEELDTFLYESSHALRRPLVRILGLLSLLETEVDEEEKAQFMSLIGYTTHNMDKMLHDLLLVSEVYQKHLTEDQTHLEAEIDKLIEPHAESDIHFVKEIEPGLRVSADAGLLRIILKKLVDNAAFYRRPDVQHAIKITARRTANGAEVRIADNGIGIDATVIPQLFKMFARGTEQSRGSGLGLFIVGKAVERLGGKVWVESEKGEGTVVFLEILENEVAEQQLMTPRQAVA
jgi:signal transduction histidine kinase